MNLRREPAMLWIGAAPAIVAALAAFVFSGDPAVQGGVNAAAVAVAGAITAFLVKSDNLLPAITGAIQAVIALVVAFGAHWDATQQTLLVTAMGVVAAIIVRDRVDAPVPAVAVDA
jgi:hypothetical protein